MKIEKDGNLVEKTEYEKYCEYLAKAATNIYPRPVADPEPHTKKQTATRSRRGTTGWILPTIAIVWEIYLLGNEHFAAAIIMGLVMGVMIISDKEAPRHGKKN